MELTSCCAEGSPLAVTHGADVESVEPREGTLEGAGQPNTRGDRRSSGPADETEAPPLLLHERAQGGHREPLVERPLRQRLLRSAVGKRQEGLEMGEAQPIDDAGREMLLLKQHADARVQMAEGRAEAPDGAQCLPRRVSLPTAGVEGPRGLAAVRRGEEGLQRAAPQREVARAGAPDALVPQGADEPQDESIVPSALARKVTQPMASLIHDVPPRPANPRAPRSNTPRRGPLAGRVVTLLCALLLAACPTASVEPEPTPPPPADTDGDGVVDEEDCAPEDASIYPGAEEACDGVDTDCDGELADDEGDEDSDGALACADDCDDTDPTLNPYDADEDGVSACDGDCDDAEPSVHPGADELTCDGRDNDCDGELVDGEEDADGDGSLACGGDCDDSRPEIHPDHEEICDGRDNNCDGVRDDVPFTPPVLEGEVSLAKARAKFLGEFEDDWVGTYVAAPGDVNGDGHQDFLMGTGRCWSCDGVDPTIPNRSYLIYGPICGEVQLGPVEDGIVDAVIFRNEVAWIGDVNGDGYDDVGAGVWVIYGPIDGADPDSWSTLRVWVGPVWSGGQVRLRGLGDINGDGFDDLAALSDRGGPADASTSGPGEVAIFLGPLGTGEVNVYYDADIRLWGQDIQPAHEAFGHTVATGDFTGDGVIDVAVGTDERFPNPPWPSIVYIFEGPLEGDLWAEDTTTRIYFEPNSWEAERIAAGDLNGDGVSDLLAYHLDGHQLFLGPLVGMLDSDLDVDLVLSVPATGDVHRVVGFGDVDGDGIDDALMHTDVNPDPEPPGFNEWDRIEVLLGSTTGSYEEAAIVGMGRDDGGYFIPGGDGEAFAVLPGSSQSGLVVGAPRGYRAGWSGGPAGSATVIFLTD